MSANSLLLFVYAKAVRLSYLLWEIWKPLCTSRSEGRPGKSVESSEVRKKSASNKSAMLGINYGQNRVQSLWFYKYDIQFRSVCALMADDYRIECRIVPHVPCIISIAFNILNPTLINVNKILTELSVRPVSSRSSRYERRVRLAIRSAGPSGGHCRLTVRSARIPSVRCESIDLSCRERSDSLTTLKL